MSLVVLHSACGLLLTPLASLPEHFQPVWIYLLSLFFTPTSSLLSSLSFSRYSTVIFRRRLDLGIPPKFVPSFTLTHASTW